MGLFQIKGLMRVSSIGLRGPHLKNSSASGRDHNRAWLTLKEQIHAKGEHCTSYKPWLQITNVGRRAAPKEAAQPAIYLGIESRRRLLRARLFIHHPTLTHR